MPRRRRRFPELFVRERIALHCTRSTPPPALRKISSMQVTSVGDFDNNSAALFTDNTPRNWIRILGRGSKSPNDDDGGDDPFGYGRAIKIRYARISLMLPKRESFLGT